MAGRAYLEYNGQRFYLGAITNVTETVQKRTGITPVVTKGMQRAFPIETGNSHSYDLSFTRKNPENAVESGTDSTRWSNAYWYRQLTNIMDRWQARTDGFMLYYEEDNTNPNFPSFSAGGYVKSISRTYNLNYNEVISGSLTTPEVSAFCAAVVSAAGAVVSDTALTSGSLAHPVSMTAAKAAHKICRFIWDILSECSF